MATSYPQTAGELVAKIAMGGSEIDHLNLMDALNPAPNHLWTTEIHVSGEDHEQVVRTSRISMEQFRDENYLESWKPFKKEQTILGEQSITRYWFKLSNPGDLEFVLYHDEGYVKPEDGGSINFIGIHYFSATSWMRVFGV